MYPDLPERSRIGFTGVILALCGLVFYVMMLAGVVTFTGIAAYMFFSALKFVIFGK